MEKNTPSAMTIITLILRVANLVLLAMVVVLALLIYVELRQLNARSEQITDGHNEIIRFLNGRGVHGD